MTALLDHLWQSTLFALMLGALTVALRRHAAGARFWLWFAASVKFLFPFSLLMALGTALAVPADPVLPSLPTLVALQQAATPFAAAAPLAPAPAGGFPWLLVLALVWAAGAALVFIAWTLRWLRLRALVRAARPLTIPGAMHAPLPVLASRAPVEPGLVGIWRPMLMLPEGIAARLSEKEMDAILAHELCHFRRRDNLTAAIHMVVECLFWFHPLVWWLGHRLMAERERACDEAVLAAGNDPQIFAEGILNVCRFYVQAPQAAAASISGADLRARIELILANRRSERLGHAHRLGLALVACLTVAAPVLTGVTGAMAITGDAARIARAYDEQARPRHAIAFDPATFDAYAGAYRGDTIITLSRESGHYYVERGLGVPSARMTPHGRMEIFPESASQFFARDMAAQYSFTRDALGRVNGLVFHQSGLERWFRRIDAGEAAAVARQVAGRIAAGRASRGTAAALVRYIAAMQQGAPEGADLSSGIRARGKLSSGGTARLVRSFGAFRSLAFAGVAADGMDLYDVVFASGHVQWWIAPLTGDGKVIWVGFAAPRQS